MNDVANNLSQYATTEVITVLAALATAWAGWKVASKSFGVVKNFTQKASFMGLAAAVMLVSGLGVGGLGLGEIMSRGTDGSQKGITNSQLESLVANGEVTQEELTTILAYVNHRDSQNGLSNEEIMQLVQKTDGEQLKAILAYISSRDGTSSRPAKPLMVAYDGSPFGSDEGSPYKIESAEGASVQNGESMMTLPYAYALALMGVGLSLGGITVFSCRNNKRNPDDPHPVTHTA